MSPIPDFFDKYHLPNGEHECTMEEIEQRFLFTEQRQNVWERFINLLNRLKEIGLEPDVLLIDGSYVTGREHPGDVDFAALIPPKKVQEAFTNLDDEHDKDAIHLFVNPNNQNAIRSMFGSHLLVARSEQELRAISKFLRKGKHGNLRDPDPKRDPDWVMKPNAKGILRVAL